MCRRERRGRTRRSHDTAVHPIIDRRRTRHHMFFPNENLEQLALRLSSGLYADPAVYARLLRDTTTIRILNPALTSVPYRRNGG